MSTPNETPEKNEPAPPSESTPLPDGDPARLMGLGLPSEAGGNPSLISDECETLEVEPSVVAAPAAGGGSAGAFVPPSVAELAGLFPQLQIIELLGHGGMGAVYKARQAVLDRFVAVKILPPQVSRSPGFAQRFMREARALAKLSHPNIVAVHDFGKVNGPHGDLYFIVMEYIDGTNLRQLIRSGAATPSEALAIVPQVCEALQFAHDEGIVHRDIKPENILIDKKGRVRIADFGLAKLAPGTGEAGHDVHTLTHTGGTMGTPRYMAPEQMEGAHDVDHRADIYSLGVVFYEMLTGEVPMGRFAAPSKRVQVDVRLDEIVLRTLEREPEQRYQQVSEVKTQVEHVSRTPVAAPRSPGTTPFVGTGPHLALCLLLSIFTLWFLLAAGGPFLTMVTGPDLALIELGKAWGLGTSVSAIFPKLAAFTALLAVGNYFTWRGYRRGRARTVGRTGEPASTGNQATQAAPTGRPRAGVAELAIVTLGLTILVPILLFIFTGDQHLVKIALLIGVIVTNVLGLISFRSHLGRYAVLLAMVVLGAHSAVQIFVTARQTSIVYPYFGETGFFSSPDGPVLSDPMARKLGITVRQQKEADRIFQDYYRQYVSLERRHTTHNRDAAGKVTVIIEPFPDEMHKLMEQLTQELRGIVDSGVAPKLPEKGKVHSQIGLFRTAGEAKVTVTLWLQDNGPTEGKYNFKQEIQWLDGGTHMSANRGHDASAIPEHFRLYWAEPAAPESNSDGGAKSTDELAAAYRDAHNRRDLDAAMRLFHFAGVPEIDEEFVRYHLQECFNIRPAKQVTYKFRPGHDWLAKLSVPPKLTMVGELSVELEDPPSTGKPQAWTAGFRYLVGRMGDRHYLVPEALKGERRVKPLILSNPTPAASAVYHDVHSASVNVVAVTPDGRSIVSCDAAGKIMCLDIAGGTRFQAEDLEASKAPATAWLSSLAISPTGTDLYAGGHWKVLHIAMGKTPSAPRKLLSATEVVHLLVPYDGGNKLACLDSQELVFHDLKANAVLARVPIRAEKSTGSVRAAAASPDGGHIAACFSDKDVAGLGAQKLTVYDVAKSGAVELAWNLPENDDSWYARVVFPDSRTLALCLPRGEIRRWTLDDAGMWKAEGEVWSINPGRYRAMAASRDGKLIYLAEGKQVVALDAKTGKQVASANLQVGPQRGNSVSAEINSIAATDQPDRVVAGLWDGRVALVSLTP